MESASFFRRLSPRRRYVAGETFFAYFAQGLALILLGSVLPRLRSAYGLDYTAGGALLAMQSVGFLTVGLFTGALALRLGLKRAYLLLFALCPLGLAVLLRGGPEPVLLGAMLLIGLTKGAVTDYNNRIITSYSGASASALNLLHASFAVGACLAPLLALGCTALAGERGWRLALLTVLGLSLAVLAAGAGMHPDGPVGAPAAGRGAGAFGFLRERLFLQTAAVGLLYQAIEASFMGWLTSFFLECGGMGDASAQLVTAALWVSLLAGRFACAALARRAAPWRMILWMSGGVLGFLLLLVLSRPVEWMLAATVGLGLCMSGLYGTSVSNAGDVFDRYPIAMGLYVSLIGVGAVAAPALVGLAADRWGLRRSMGVLVVCAAGLLAAAAVNAAYFRRRETAGAKR
jgi:fucose permease